jgi:hypothetical protein
VIASDPRSVSPCAGGWNHNKSLAAWRGRGAVEVVRSVQRRAPAFTLCGLGSSHASRRARLRRSTGGTGSSKGDVVLAMSGCHALDLPAGRTLEPPASPPWHRTASTLASRVPLGCVVPDWPDRRGVSLGFHAGLVPYLVHRLETCSWWPNYWSTSNVRKTTSHVPPPTGPVAGW